MPLPRSQTTNQALRAVVAEAGSQAAAARLLGLARGTFDDHWRGRTVELSSENKAIADRAWDLLPQATQDRIQLVAGLMAERSPSAQQTSAMRLAADADLLERLLDKATEFVLGRQLSLDEWAAYAGGEARGGRRFVP